MKGEAEGWIFRISENIILDPKALVCTVEGRERRGEGRKVGYQQEKALF